jgi:hypothetical protein
MVLTQKAAQIAGLTVLERLIAPASQAQAGISSERPAAASVPEDVLLPGVASDVTPPFITEVADKDARRYRTTAADGTRVYAGFYSDGRVRLATPEGKRYSGFIVDEKAVMADLHEDVSFEMVLTSGAADKILMVSMDAGPYGGQRLLLETLA